MNNNPRIHAWSRTTASTAVRMFLLCIFCLPLSAVTSVQKGPSQQISKLDLALPHPEKIGNLAEVLGFIASEYEVPVIAELVYPLPQKLRIPSGTHTAPALIRELMRQTRDYSWERRGKVAHIFNNAVRSAPENLLNGRFSRYQIPSNVGDLQWLLPTRLKGLVYGQKGEGFAASGFRTLEDLPLQPVLMKNVSGLEVLIEAANQSGRFYSIVVFPKLTPTKDDADWTLENWVWGDLKNPQPFYLQAPAKKAVVPTHLSRSQ
jgi:hypothetical protein